jgi:hypothetical protein
LHSVPIGVPELPDELGVPELPELLGVPELPDELGVPELPALFEQVWRSPQLAALVTHDATFASPFWQSLWQVEVYCAAQTFWTLLQAEVHVSLDGGFDDPPLDPPLAASPEDEEEQAAVTRRAKVEAVRMVRKRFIVEGFGVAARIRHK